MKKQFDELIRQQFDQGEFDYNPRNWEKMAQRLDGKPGKRRRMLWLPLTAVATLSSIAASLAMIISVGTILHHQPSEKAMAVVVEKNTINTRNVHVQQNAGAQPLMADANTNTILNNTSKITTPSASTFVGLQMPADNKKLFFKPINGVLAANVFDGPAPKIATEQKHNTGYSTGAMLYNFEPEEENKKAPSVMISLIGGVNHGNVSSGYMVGATAKKNLSDKVFVESDIAFSSSNATQTAQYTTVTTLPTTALTRNSAARNGEAGKLLSAGDNTPKMANTITSTETRDNNYNLYYAQVTPAIGYNILKRISIGAGADMQHVLVDNRPAASATDPGNQKEMPLFDMGFVGKAEYSLSKNFKAGVYYRQGVNNLITPVNKYIDRNYLQVQLKYTIFNK